MIVTIVSNSTFVWLIVISTVGGLIFSVLGDWSNQRANMKLFERQEIERLAREAREQKRKNERYKYDADLARHFHDVP